MASRISRRAKQRSTMHRYGDQLGLLVNRKRTELALRTAKRDAEQSAVAARESLLNAEAANHAKTYFLANMSHELRTPLNAILGFSDILKKNQITPAGSAHNFNEYAGLINDSGRHLLNIVNDLLDSAKIEAGEFSLREEEFDPRECARSCLAMVAGLAAERGVEMRSYVAETMPRVRGDEQRFRQILINILSNALKFTPSGKSVTLEASRQEQGGIVFRISDEGIGIEAENIRKALMPFQQVETGENRPSEGTGLGLSLAKAFAELHDGSLELESEFGVGTSVTVRLPADREIGART